MQLHGSELKKGVVIKRGASPWQIFQQNEQGFAIIRLSGTAHRVRQSFELPLEFSAVPEGSITVKARIALESSGESVCPWTVCRTEADGRWSVTFDCVPAGGLYRVETYMEYQGWDGLSSTRGDMIHNIGVGDVFVVAGQSNAAGRAKNPVEDAPELGVHLLRGCLRAAAVRRDIFRSECRPAAPDRGSRRCPPARTAAESRPARRC